MSTEALRCAATLNSASRLSKTFGEEMAVENLVSRCKGSASKAIEVSTWLLRVTRSVDRFLQDRLRSRAAVAEIAQARLLAVAIILKGLPIERETELMDTWEKTSFRVFGLCRKDKRTGVGDYVRLAWDMLNHDSNGDAVLQRMKKISEGTDHSIEWAVEHLSNANCYDGWEEELRYLLYRYEEYLARINGLKFSNEQWNRIWEVSAVQSIEHILPQSKGSQERVSPGMKSIFVHRLGNLMLLPPDLNSTLLALDPRDKAEAYLRTGLLDAAEIANTIRREGWDEQQVAAREKHLLEWVKSTWA